jgi:hypothetical protein
MWSPSNSAMVTPWSVSRAPVASITLVVEHERTRFASVFELHGELGCGRDTQRRRRTLDVVGVELRDDRAVAGDARLDTAHQHRSTF